MEVAVSPRMILDPYTEQPITSLDPEVIRLTIYAHRAINASAYLDRYHYRKFLMLSGLIDKWRTQGHVEAR